MESEKEGGRVRESVCVRERRRGERGKYVGEWGIYVIARVYKEGGRVLNRVYTARNIRSEGSRPLK